MGGFGRSDLHRRGLLSRPYHPGSARPADVPAFVRRKAKVKPDLLQPVQRSDLLERDCTGFRVTRGVGFVRPVECRLALGVRLVLGALHRARCRLVMKLCADGLGGAWLPCSARCRNFLCLADLQLDLRNLRAAGSGMGSRGTAHQRQRGYHRGAPSGHDGLSHSVPRHRRRPIIPLRLVRAPAAGKRQQAPFSRLGAARSSRQPSGFWINVLVRSRHESE
jgi:hypothetical protein